MKPKLQPNGKIHVFNAVGVSNILHTLETEAAAGELDMFQLTKIKNQLEMLTTYIA